MTEKGTPEPPLEEVPEEPSPLEQLMLEEEQIKYVVVTMIIENVRFQVDWERHTLL